MGFLSKKPEIAKQDTVDAFGRTTNFIHDELDNIQSQQENIVVLSAQLEKAISQTERMRELMKIVKKIDKTIAVTIDERRKEESGMVHLIEDIKTLLAEQRYESIDRLLSSVHKKSQQKIRLSQDELRQVRELMLQLNDLYQEAYGFLRLYQLLYGKLEQIYNSCSAELQTEISEEADLNKAGEYSGAPESRNVTSYSFKNLLGDGVKNWMARY